MFSFEKTTLDNGLRVITAPLNSSPSITVGILVGAGSRYESKKINGLAHVLEHMFFKGTKNRPTAADIARESEGMGAVHNAWTDVEAVGYWMKAPPEHLEKSMDILTDMLLNPLLSEQELAKERHVVIEELNRDEDDHPRKVAEIFQELLWPKQALGRPIIGTKQTILATGRDDLARYLDKLYVASNTVVVVAGPVDHQIVVKLCEQKLAGMSTKRATLSWEKAKENQSRPLVTLLGKKAEQAHLILGYRGLSVSHPKRPILTVLNSVMGLGMSSRLFLNIREEKHLAYAIASWPDYFHDTGYWGIYAGVTIDRLTEVIKAIKEEIIAIKEQLVPDRELAESKEKYKGRLLFSLESSQGVMDYFARQELIERQVKLPQQWLSKVEQVTAEQVRSLARQLFTTQSLNLAVLGPYESKVKKELEQLLVEF